MSVTDLFAFSGEVVLYFLIIFFFKFYIRLVCEEGIQLYMGALSLNLY